MRETKHTFTAAAAALLLALAAGSYVRGSGLDQTGPAPASAAEQLAALKDEGQTIYNRECASCHGAEGTGDGAGPALADNSTLSGKEHVIKRILQGDAEHGMDPFAAVLNDRQVAAVATYVRNAWDNSHGAIVEADVKPLRDQLPKK
ncbi:MAG: cytochrome c [Vicinamibacterales bacterium]